MSLSPAAINRPPVGSVRIQTGAIARSDLESAAIVPVDVIAGSPVARSRALSVSADGDLRSGLWDCTAGRFRWESTVDESVHVLEGEVTITSADSQTVTLRSGDTAYVPLGAATVWEVPDYVRTFATTRATAGTQPSGSVSIQTGSVDRTDLEPAPIRRGDVLAGSPVARSLPVSVASDGKFGSWLWDCTAGRFHWNFTVDEIVHILEGEVTITGADGQTVTLRSGDTAYFPLGAATVWDVPDYVRKLATSREPALGTLSRGVRWLKRVTRPLRVRLRELSGRA